ncbi:MAG: hypothetical protein ACFB4I_08745 [Cyanophyceae cyanobacterium]
MHNQPRPTDPQDAAYREGYVQGQTTERQNTENGIATGWLLGLLFAALTALGIGAFYLTQREPAANTAPDVNITQPQSTEKETIIERTVDKTTEVVPVPSDIDINVPEVDVDVPDPQPNEASQAGDASDRSPKGELEVDVPASPEQN